MVITMPAPIDPWPGRTEVGAPDLMRAAGIERDALRHIQRSGLVPAAGGGGHGRQVRYSKDDALFLFAAALFAAALGAALINVVRRMLALGASRPVDGAFAIPVPVAA